MTVTEPLETRTHATPWNRIAGAGAITFAVLALAANIVVPKPPAWDASGTEVASWVHDHHGVLAFTTSEYAIAAVALMIFAAGLLRAARQSGDEDTHVFATIGMLGMLLILALFGTVVLSRLITLGLDGSANASPALVEFSWHIESAAFMLNMVAVGIALFGVTGAAVRMGLAPHWYKPVSIVGLLAAIAATLQAPAAVNGANGWQIGFLTFLSWEVLLLIVGTRMVRES
jgi:hypothetical protein